MIATMLRYDVIQQGLPVEKTPRVRWDLNDSEMIITDHTKGHNTLQPLWKSKNYKVFSP